MIPSSRLELILGVVEEEVISAQKRFPVFASPHEGWAIIQEEVDELWELVKANDGRGEEAMIEAKQIAAMGVRYALDLWVAL